MSTEKAYVRSWIILFVFNFDDAHAVYYEMTLQC